jgi:hypothetical protein
MNIPIDRNAGAAITQKLFLMRNDAANASAHSEAAAIAVVFSP